MDRPRPINEENVYIYRCIIYVYNIIYNISLRVSTHNYVSNHDKTSKIKSSG